MNLKTINQIIQYLIFDLRIYLFIQRNVWKQGIGFVDNGLYGGRERF